MRSQSANELMANIGMMEITSNGGNNIRIGFPCCNVRVQYFYYWSFNIGTAENPLPYFSPIYEAKFYVIRVRHLESKSLLDCLIIEGLKRYLVPELSVIDQTVFIFRSATMQSLEFNY